MLIRRAFVLGLCVLICSFAMSKSNYLAAETDAAHSSAEAGHGGSSGGTPEFLKFEIPLAVWTLVVFVGLLFVLWKFAWGPLIDAIDAREANVREAHEGAQRARNEAERLVEEHRNKLDLAQDEVREILEEARRDAQHTSQEILRKAEQEAQATQERSLRDVERATEQALREIAEQAAAMVTQTAARVVQSAVDEQQHRQLIEASLGEFSRQSAN